MKQYFHGADKRGPYFEGWYFKCQTRDGKAMALIPAFHIDSGGQKSASIQVITGSGTWWLDFLDSDFHASPDRLLIQVGSSVFWEAGLELDIRQDQISLHGRLSFGPFLPLQSDIMGPFRFLADMECAHGVISMTHSIHGQLVLNGEIFDFDGGTGYVETDRGRSFPSSYLWTQYSWQKNSLMLSIASIPLAKIRFTGCICAIVYQGREYRIATYLGAKAESWSHHGAVVRQGKYRLEVNLLEKQAQPLRAPTNGVMGRTIHESICAKLQYRFWIGENLLFDHTDVCASFEYAKTI